MPTQGLNPGDRVVDLAALVVSVAVATGAVTGALLVWLIKRGWLAAAAAFVVGAVIGFVLGFSARSCFIPHGRPSHYSREGW